MKRTSYFVGLVASALLLAGCTATTAKPAQPTNAGSQVDGAKAAEDKKGDTTVTGMISKVGEKFFITTPGQSPREIESYAIKLDEHVGKSVTVVGQYSGDTLFVGKVQ